MWYVNTEYVFHNGEIPIPAGLVHLWFSSTAEFGMAKSRICGRLALYQDLYRRHRIGHCWCCVFSMCNARVLKASVAASNVALKPNAEHLEHN